MKYLVIIVALALSIMNISEASKNINHNKLKDKEYESYCKKTGDLVCMDCKHTGVCSQSGNYFIATPSTTCDVRQVCDPSFQNGTCALVGPSLAKTCMCGVGTTKCTLDPSNSLSYINCTDTKNITYGTCKDGEQVNLTTCTCTPTPCPPCNYYKYSATDCTRYIYCVGTSRTEGRCPGNLCFDPLSCTCMPSCPACGYISDPTSTNKYYNCAGGSYVPGVCPSGYTFNNSTCFCENVPATTTTTATTTTATKTSSATTTPTKTTTATSTTTPPPVTCPACGYTTYPGDNTKYYKCVNGVVYIGTCPSGYYYNNVDCYCE